MRAWILLTLIMMLATIYSPALYGSASAQEAATETVPIVTAGSQVRVQLNFLFPVATK